MAVAVVVVVVVVVVVAGKKKPFLACLAVAVDRSCPSSHEAYSSNFVLVAVIEPTPIPTQEVMMMMMRSSLLRP